MADSPGISPAENGGKACKAGRNQRYGTFKQAGLLTCLHLPVGPAFPQPFRQAAVTFPHGSGKRKRKSIGDSSP